MIQVRKTITAGASRVWKLLEDTNTWSAWGPSVTEVELWADALRAGSRGRIRLPLGPWIPFRVTDFEPGRYFRWSVAKIPATGHRVCRLGENRCELTFEVPLWAAPHGYELAQLEAAETHEPLWSAAQRQLARDGTIRNDLRRAWGPVRPIFGKVRYMSSESTARKIRVKSYLEEYTA